MWTGISSFSHVLCVFPCTCVFFFSCVSCRHEQLLTVEERKIGLQGFSDHWLESGMQLDHSKYAEKVSFALIFFLCLRAVLLFLRVGTMTRWTCFFSLTYDGGFHCSFPPQPSTLMRLVRGGPGTHTPETARHRMVSPLPRRANETSTSSLAPYAGLARSALAACSPPARRAGEPHNALHPSTAGGRSVPRQLA